MQTSRAPLLPEPARKLAAWCVVMLLVTGVAAVLVWLCVVFQSVVTPVLLAILGAALLGPLYRWLLRMRVRKSLAAGVTVLAILVVVGGAAYIVVAALIKTGDQIITSLRKAADDITEHLGAIGTSLDDVAKNAEPLLKEFGGTAASGVISGLGVVSQMMATTVLALILVFFFLKDSDRAVGTLRSLAPRASGDLVEAMARRAYEAVEGYMRGTTFVALVDAVIIGLGLIVLDVPGAVGLAALVFVTAYIPYLGAFLSGAVAVLVALADRGLVIALWVFGIVLAVQMLEGNVLQPLVQSKTVHMHPAVVLLALTAGGTVAGILGMLLAIPLTAAATSILNELRKRYGSDRPSPAGEEGTGAEAAAGV
ncbi:AI-2E family transporter [Streptomyces sp. NPDC056144]|uniref:AI-2E family transporter n=1 Tax=unclassified Streptomyces TaxID=2593676 RepID=UPI0035DB79B9